MYGKLFAQMYDGTLATKGPWQALATFQQLIILADKHGTVDMTAEAIARRTTFPLEVIRLGLSELEKPDPDSRTPDEEGRRIVRLSDHRPWGWRIVNHSHYRKIRSEDDRREYHKLYQRERRAKNVEAVNSDVNTSTARQQNQPIAVSSKQDAVSRMHKPPANINRGGDAYANGIKIFTEIREKRVEMRTPNGPRSHIPKEVVDALPARARAALEAIGGVSALLEATDATGLRVLKLTFARVYASEEDLPSRERIENGKRQVLRPTKHGDRWFDEGVA